MDSKKLEILTAKNSALLLIDYQPEMAFGVVNIDRQSLKNNAVALTKGSYQVDRKYNETSCTKIAFKGHGTDDKNLSGVGYPEEQINRG